MKILHVADLHLNHDWFDWVASHCSDYDVLVIAGDLQNAFSNVSIHDQAKAVSKWLLSLTTATCVVSGKHDYWIRDFFSSHPEDCYCAEARWLKRIGPRLVHRDTADPRNFLRYFGSIIAVDGDFIEKQGVRIAANGWTQVPSVEGKIDILVTHAPPSGCHCASGASGHDNGDPNLFPALRNHPPRMILAGHIHAPRDYVCAWGSVEPTTLVFVPGCDEEAEIPNHWIIDTDACNARHSSGRIIQFHGKI